METMAALTMLLAIHTIQFRGDGFGGRTVRLAFSETRRHQSSRQQSIEQDRVFLARDLNVDQMGA